MVPTIPPMPVNDPTHAISDDVNAPLSNGDLFDSRIKNADDVQPNVVPMERTQIFAIKQINKF